MLVGMHMIVETGDHDPDNHRGKALEVFVKQLAALSGTSGQTAAGGPKRNNIDSNGPQTKHRLGSVRSNMTGRKQPPKCTFCGGMGGGAFHASARLCPLKNSYGVCMDVKKDGVSKIADDIETIFSGTRGVCWCCHTW